MLTHAGSPLNPRSWGRDLPRGGGAGRSPSNSRFLRRSDGHGCTFRRDCRGDRLARRRERALRAATLRLKAIFSALTRSGMRPVPAPYDSHADTFARRLRDMDAVLVWVDPDAGGRNRNALDGISSRVGRIVASAPIPT